MIYSTGTLPAELKALLKSSILLWMQCTLGNNNNEKIPRNIIAEKETPH